MVFFQLSIGAGEGNRTLVISLEGFCSTIELHPQQESVVRYSSQISQTPIVIGPPDSAGRSAEYHAPEQAAQGLLRATLARYLARYLALPLALPLAPPLEPALPSPLAFPLAPPLASLLGSPFAPPLASLWPSLLGSPG